MTETKRKTALIEPGVERRAKTRFRSPRLILVKLADENGGVAPDITEDGLGLAVAMPLVPDHLPSIRIRLAGSNEWIEARGSIVWKSESKRSAGVRFVDLSNEARQQIRSWIGVETGGSQASAEAGSSPSQEEAGREQSARVALASGEAVTKPAKEAIASSARNDDEQEYGRGGPDRRSHQRRKLLFLADVQWDGNKGGVALDLGEGGLALVSAAAFTGDELLVLRFQLPDTKDHIEASGQIAWKTKSGKRAGVKFVGLDEAARRQIRNWVSRQGVPDQAVAPNDDFAPALPAIEPETRAPISAAGKFSRAASPELQSHFTRPPLRSAHVDESARLPDKPTLGSQYSYPADIHGERDLRGKRLSLRARYAQKGTALVVLVAALSFGIGWVTSSPSIRNAIVRFVNNRSVSREAGGSSPIVGRREEAAAPDRELAPAGQPASEGNRRTLQAQAPVDQRQRSDSEAPFETSPANAPRRRTDLAPRPSREEAPDHKPQTDTKAQAFYPSAAPNAVANNPVAADRPTMSSAQKEAPGTPPQAQTHIEPENPPRPSSAPATSAAPAPVNHDGEPSSPPPPIQQTPANLTGSVVIVADRYPSIRLPVDPNPKKSPTGERLQLGHLMSRVEPVYPSDAKRNGIEGNVDMHALIGRDGSIEDLVSVNGPPLLISAAVNAVRQWKFSQTLVAGQPVETEENISVRFQLLH